MAGDIAEDWKVPLCMEANIVLVDLLVNLAHVSVSGISTGNGISVSAWATGYRPSRASHSGKRQTLGF